MQAPQTLGGRSGEGGTREGLCGPSGPTLSKNQADSVRPCGSPHHGGNVYGPGKVILICHIYCKGGIQIVKVTEEILQYSYVMS